MAQLFILLVSFLFIGLLALAVRRHKPAPPLPQLESLPSPRLESHLRVAAAAMPWQRRRRLPRRIPCIRLLNRLLRSKGSLPALTYLQDHGRSLLLQLMSLGGQLRHAPALPAPALGAPRLLHLCQRYSLLGGSTEARDLLSAAEHIQADAGLTLDERLLLPLGLRLALAQQLEAVLAHLHLCLTEYQRGLLLAKRLRRARRPMQLLSNRRLTLTETQAMLAHLTACQESSLLASIEERMAQEHFSSQQVMEQHTHHQTMLADHLRRILSGLQTLEKLDWPRLLEPADPLHALLLHDPAGTYPRMDADSRSLYRQRVAALARLFHADETRLAQEALALCALADPDGLRDHVGWYLLEPVGIRALHRHLHTRWGATVLLLRQAAPWLYRAGLGLGSLGGGLLFLNALHPLWTLPIFLGVWSCLTHWLADALIRQLVPVQPLPRMRVAQVEENARVLIVLPAVLQDTTQAVSAVRRLLLARSAFPAGAVDCLLLGDFADCITRTSSRDGAIVTAARMAADAADSAEERCLYLQRQRTWADKQRIYMGRDREQGALECLHQLIVHGECPDTFDAASLPPSAFHRRYAYVLALDASTTPSPDSLLPLLGALTHPLNERRHTAEGVRGISIAAPQLAADAASVRSRMGLWADAAHGSLGLCQRLTDRSSYQGKGLYRPDALLEATEGWLMPGATLASHWLEGELSGCALDVDQVFFQAQPASTVQWLEQLHRRTWGLCQLLPWLLPHVKTPGGVRRNPLSSHSKYRLRQGFRQCLMPLCRLLLLVYAVLSRSLLLGLLALLAPELPLGAPGRFLAQLVELPLVAAVQGEALVRSLWRSYVLREKQLHCQSAALADGGASLSLWEGWSQGLSVLAVAMAALAIQPVSLPGLGLALVFACFPLVRPWLDAPLRLSPPPTRQMADSLLEVCHATWRFFEETVTEETRHLPPEHLQIKPWRGTAAHTSPAGIGLYLLSCLAARELGLMDTAALCSRVAHTMDSMECLPLWHGLPYRSYAMASLTAADSFVSSQECGILCACLIALAQGLRSNLPSTPEKFATLSRRVDDFAHRMELFRLYDTRAQLFCLGFDTQQNTLDDVHHSLYASEALLLSFVAVMERQVPSDHLAKLSRALVRTGRNTPYVSLGGTAAEYLLPRLLLPTAPGTAMAHTLHAVIHSQRRHGVDGMFGLSASSYWGFDPHLNYRQQSFGLPELALGACRPRRVIAPYAAALCLSFAPEAAYDSLMRLRSRGMLGRLGYFDSLDLDPAHLADGVEEAPVQQHTAYHQGMLLCALCNELTGNILVRHFTAVPAAAAAVPLLQEKHRPWLTLPARLLHPENLAPKEPPFRRSAQPLSAPMDAHIIGSPEAMLLMSAQGLGTMRSRGVELTRFTGDPTQVEGIQFYLHDGLTSYRLTDPALSGDTIFGEGCLRFIRTCGQMQAQLTALTDPVQGTFLHMIEVSNPTNRERHIDLASCLIPALSPADQPCPDEAHMETARPEERVLTITRASSPDGPQLTLCHGISTHEALLGLAAETDRCAFQGRNRTLHSPAALEAPLRDGLVGLSVTPCASFRARLRIGPRGRTAVIFITQLLGSSEAFSLEALAPRLSDVGNLLPLSRLLSRTMTDSLSLTQARAAELSRLFGALLWRNQPHQGAVLPLTCPASRLTRVGLTPTQPLLTVMVHSRGCAALVQDASDTVQWLGLMGQKVNLCILCEGDQATQAQARAAEVLLSRTTVVLLSSELEDGMRETLEAASRVILYEGSGSIAAQLDAQAQGISAARNTSTPTPPPLEEEKLNHATAYGGFQPDTEDFIIHLEASATPAPWHSLLTSGTFGTSCTESGLGTSFAGSRSLTRRDGDPVCPAVAECAYLSSPLGLFTPTPLPLGQGMSTRVQLSPDVTTWHSLGYGLDTSLTAAPIPETTFACRTLRLNNTTQAEQHLTLTIAANLAMGQTNEAAAYACLTPIEGGVAAVSPEIPCCGCLALVDASCESRTVSPLAFYGFGDVPNLSAPADEAGTVALLTVALVIPPGGSESVSWLLGACQQLDELELLLARLRETGTSIIYREVRQQWAARLGQLTIQTPDEALNLLMNRLLPWQVRASIATETAISFADFLQAMAALTYTEPDQVRACLLTCARHQYTEGDVQRWWYPPQTGLRARQVEDQLLLPLITCWFVHRTGDRSVLDEQVPWLLGNADEQPAAIEAPPTTQEQDSLYTHCLRALTSVRLGPHGLPMADEGESVWLGMLYAYALRLLAQHTEGDARTEMEEVRARLVDAIERHGWDGSWYAHALTADGTALGSAANPACRLSCLSQCWAVLALGVTQRTAQAMEHAWQQLYDPRHGLLKQAVTLRHKANRQETSATVWMLWALCDLGWTDRAWALTQALNPVLRDPDVYRLEPYTLACGIHAHPQQLGQGCQGRSTSGAAWLYALVLEKLLGFEKRGDQVRLHPLVPTAWEGFSLTLQWGASTWHFHAGREEPLLTCDGEKITTGWMTLQDDGRIHEVRTPLRQGV